MLKELLSEVERISREVGAYLREEQNKIRSVDVQFKSKSNDLVSHADKEAERRFVEALRSVLPQAGFIAEEGTSEEGEGEYHWIIDPLDGTTNYLYGIPCYCTSVGLKQNDEIVLGVIYDPVHDECFSAAKGLGAKLNGKPMRVSAQADLSHSLVAMGFPYEKRGKLRTYLDILHDINEKTRGMRRPGAAAIDMAYVACGRFDAFYEYGLNPWDIAAGTILIREAGGTVTDFHGGDTFLFGETILCSNSLIHKDISKLFQNWK